MRKSDTTLSERSVTITENSLTEAELKAYLTSYIVAKNVLAKASGKEAIAIAQARVAEMKAFLTQKGIEIPKD